MKSEHKKFLQLSQAEWVLYTFYFQVDRYLHRLFLESSLSQDHLATNETDERTEHFKAVDNCQQGNTNQSLLL